MFVARVIVGSYNFWFHCGLLTALCCVYCHNLIWQTLLPEISTFFFFQKMEFSVIHTQSSVMLVLSHRVSVNLSPKLRFHASLTTLYI